MQTVAVTNQKGGVGKTTTTVNLAAALGSRKKRVLVVDLDPQANATSWLSSNEDAVDSDRSLFDALTTGAALPITATTTPNVELVPSSTWLVGVERALSSEVGAESLLKEAIDRLPSKRWDYILIDCPPSLGLLAISALTAADSVLVPVEAKVMALSGLASLVQTVERVQQRLNPSLSLGSIVACRVTRTRLAKEVVEQLRKTFPKETFKNVIRENIKIAEAWSHGEPISSYAPTSHGAEDYRAVGNEFLRRQKRRPKRRRAQARTRVKRATN